MKIFQVILSLLIASSAFAFSGSFAGNTLARPASTSQLNMAVKVIVGDGEPVDSALQRWRRQVNRSGHLMVLRNRRYFENNQEKAIRKEAMARKRRSIMRSKMRSSGMLDGSSSPVQALKVDKFTRAVMAGRDTTLLGN
ncbi:unnamed protein product [Heterosigma akashiwo]|mmetsp:Transcript_15089/g.22926  ORF Transcript_15089/g.22926 Transcript_15089/m.22926 type:complete len:139 (+) Transcript_15089:102-518(+)